MHVQEDGGLMEVKRFHINARFPDLAVNWGGWWDGAAAFSLYGDDRHREGAKSGDSRRTATSFASRHGNA
jgi:hypothetical protein